MEAKKKTSLLYIACAAILLTLLGSFVMFLALSTDFTPALGYFTKGSLTAFLLYIVLAAGTLLGGIVWFCLRRCRLTEPSLPMPLYTRAASVLLIAALLWQAGDTLRSLFSAGGRAPLWGLTLLCVLFSLFFILFLCCDMGPGRVRRGSLAAFCSFFPPLYTAGQLFLLYLDETVALNSPVKVIYQLMYIAFMLLFTAQTGLLLGKGAIFPRYVFCLIAAAVLAGSVSISALLCVAAGVQGHTLSPAQILFSLAGSIYALCQLFSAASAAAQWTEEEKKEA